MVSTTQTATQNLIKAIIADDMDGFEHWLSLSDPKADNSEALRWACREGREALVRLLLPLSNPLALDSQALCDASQNNHEAIVRLLLPVSDPKAQDFLALYLASARGHETVVDLLLEYCDLQEAWEIFLRVHEWASVDTLASRMPREAVQSAITQAPLQALPKARARHLNEILMASLEKITIGSPISDPPRSRF